MILDFSKQLKCPRALHSADRHLPLSHRYRHKVPQELPRRSCACALMGVHRSEFARHVMDVPSHLGQSEDATAAKWSILGFFYCLWQLESIYAGFCFELFILMKVTRFLSGLCGPSVILSLSLTKRAPLYPDCSVFVLAFLPPGDRRPNRRLCGPPVWLTEWCTFMNHLVRFPNWRAAFCHPDIFIHAYKCHAVESLPPSKNWNSHRRFFRFFPFLFLLATLGQKVEYLKCSGKVCPHSLCAGVEARYKQPSVVRDKPQLNALITPSCCFQSWKFTYSSF